MQCFTIMMSLHIAEFESRILKFVIEIKEDIKLLVQQSTLNAQQKTQDLATKIPFSFPIDDWEDVLKFDNWIKEETNYLSVVCLYIISLYKNYIMK